MSKAKRLQPVIGVAAREEQKATDAFLAAQLNYNKASQKLDELIAYRTEYRGRQTSTGGLLNLSQLQDNRTFLGKLSEIIEIQRSVVRQCGTQMEAARAIWLEKRQKALSLDKLADGYRAQEDRQLQQREQKHSDELNVLRHSWQLKQVEEQ